MPEITITPAIDGFQVNVGPFRDRSRAAWAASVIRAAMEEDEADEREALKRADWAMGMEGADLD